MTIISVMLCTHNPNKHTLGRVLRSLAEQTLDFQYWEVVIVDNASDPSVNLSELATWDLPPVLLVKEPKLGLTKARISGIRECRGPVIVLIDDDTVLDPSYLQIACSLFYEHPEIGVAGGRIKGEFEVEPPQWLWRHLDVLAIRDFGDLPIRALICNRSGPWEPCGAGMVIRSAVAQHYAKLASHGPRQEFDRVANRLTSCGDTDLARTAGDMGMVSAYEPGLTLTHLIPKTRLSFRYVIRLCYSIQRDGWSLYRLRGMNCEISVLKFIILLMLAPVKCISWPPVSWLIRIAEEVGRLRGRRINLRAK